MLTMSRDRTVCRLGELVDQRLSAFVAAVMFSLFAISIANGHATDESYIWLNPQKDCFDGHVEFRLDDLRKYFGLEIPEEYAAARETVLANRSMLEEYVKEHFSIARLDGSEIPYSIVKVDLLDNEFFGHFAQIFYATGTLVDVPAEVVVKSNFLFEHDKFSRCLLCMQYNYFTGESHPERFFHAVFSPWNNEQQIDFNNVDAVKGGRSYYVWEGIRHIWIGIDHILFLVTLLLASVLVKQRVEEEQETAEKGEGEVESRYEWLPVHGFRGAFWNVFKIVTIFTIAHSITLALASLDFISLPSQLVELIIALSIVLVAFNNIIPTFRDRTWIILFLFGLFHGMGFASVMQNLPFRMPALKQLLVCFNIGVELGQMAIVIAVFPLIFYVRKSAFYKPVVLIGGSSVIILIAGYWFVERAMGWG